MAAAPRRAARHIAAHSISLRGTAGSPCVEKSIKLSTHASDVAEAIALQLPEKQLALCAHSFGGPVAIDALATDEDLADRCAGLALLCSVPPSGNKPGTARVVRRSLREAWLITKAFALKTAARSSEDANAVFFNDQLDDETAARYTSYFAADSSSGLDLGDYQRSLPRWPTEDGRWASMPLDLRCLVLGADADRVVDREAVDETAKPGGGTVVEGPHDGMRAENEAERRRGSSGVANEAARHRASPAIGATRTRLARKAQVSARRLSPSSSRRARSACTA